MQGDDWEPKPTTKDGWLRKWTQKAAITVPNWEGHGIVKVQTANIMAPQFLIHSRQQPDLIVTTQDNWQFHVVFKNERSSYNIGVPTLIWPEQFGESHAFWVWP